VLISRSLYRAASPARADPGFLRFLQLEYCVVDQLIEPVKMLVEFSGQAQIEIAFEMSLVEKRDNCIRRQNRRAAMIDGKTIDEAFSAMANWTSTIPEITNRFRKLTVDDLRRIAMLYALCQEHSLVGYQF
jgi:hypothetical protein